MAKTTFSKFLLLAALLCAVFSELALGDTSGTATFYTAPYVPSACGITDPNQLPPGGLFAAASDPIWNGGGACGSKYQITCTGPTNQGVPQPCRSGTITVQIVDYCPSGCQGTFDLSAEAFADIADPNAGKIFINYNRV
ncbi:hypothetical protein O6H91_15G029900 [Diphasiastrum complanatum]|uniref:Uncharacterized protein n=1 Tax=Diphasiastrum complanatum TaxID=34168 RepID=A0ACC2BGX1_DIPCM|nr:hypothetical protein O6H91_15G029900 [Diphasiastrum complanatum]